MYQKRLSDPLKQGIRSRESCLAWVYPYVTSSRDEFACGDDPWRDAWQGSPRSRVTHPLIGVCLYVPLLCPVYASAMTRGGCQRTQSTEVLILGVAHLDRSTTDSALERGLRYLRAWGPDVVSVENLPGHLVVEYEQRGGAFADFPVGGAPIARQGAALVQNAPLWSVWQAREVARDRKHSIAERVGAWLHAREPLNALLLPWRDAGLAPPIVRFLRDLSESPSERVRVGVHLAHSCGLKELVHFDDHAGVDILNHLPADWPEKMLKFRGSSGDRLIKSDPYMRPDVDEWSRWIAVATPEFRAWNEQSESGWMVQQPDSSGILRARLAQWRTRNLAMAARLREATALAPGGKVLAIVGSSHERPLRAALGVDQHDLILTDLSTLDVSP